MQHNSTLTILGSCSGIEPVAGHYYTSLALSHNGRLYWFDTGETCSHTAHVTGLDLATTEAIFISHTHIDHVGGLPNLIWTLRRLCSLSKDANNKLAGRTIPVYLPEIAPFDGIMQFLRNKAEKNFITNFTLEPRLCHDGSLFTLDDYSVTALHNSHVNNAPPWLSFSFRITAGPAQIVYSGDFKTLEEIEPLINGANLLLLETGHHTPTDICTWLLEHKKEFDQLLFIHHGRRILEDPAGELQKCRAILGDRVELATDGMTLVL